MIIADVSLQTAQEVASNLWWGGYLTGAGIGFACGFAFAAYVYKYQFRRKTA